MMKKIQLIVFFIIAGFSLQAQTAWIIPDPTTADFDPAKESTLYIDVTKSSDCSELGTAGDLYLWTWSPNELPEGNSKANGEWSASNPELKLTDEGNGIYSFTFVPTEFYEVSAEEVYEKDFSFLVKALDGSGGKTTCSEDKTEDLKVEAVPFVLAKKVGAFPEVGQKDTLFTRPGEFFTLIYDRSLEEDMNILSADNYFVFAKAVGTDGRTYTYATPAQLDSKPELQMIPDEEDKFYWTVQPEIFFGDLLPDGVSVSTLRLQIAKEGARSNGDLVDGTFEFFYKCN